MATDGLTGYPIVPLDRGKPRERVGDELVTGLPNQSAVLRSGTSMPLLGFGTWRITGERAATPTVAAPSTGYRHIDTATHYGNE